MSSCFLALTKTRLRIFFVISTCFVLLGLISALFPSASGAKSQPQSQLQEPAAGKSKRSQYVPGELLVRYRSESVARGKTGVSTVHLPNGASTRVQVERFEGSDLVEGLRLARVAARDTLKALAALRKQPDVLYAEPNYILRASKVPNDPRFAQQSGLTKIDAPTAWNTTTGNSSVVVAVLDQGINVTHEDLAANVWTNPAPGSVSGISGDLHGYNFIDNNGTVFSGSSLEDHASHVAGILGAVGDNSTGVSGVNWSVGLMSLKFLKQNRFGNTVNAIRACNYAREMRQLWLSEPVGTKGANVRVINASFGGDRFSQALLDSVVELNHAGILFVAAAGNIRDGTSNPNNDLVPHYPSSFDVPNIIAVAATDSLDQVPGFSHFGATSVDLAAPGVSILSTVPAPTLYGTQSGTSMSVPFVSGAAALLWAQNPTLTVAQVKNLLLLNGDIQASLNAKTLTGRRLNVAKSFDSLVDLPDNQAPGIPAGFNITSLGGRTLNLGWTATGDNGTVGSASLYQVSFTDGTSGAVIPLKGVMPAVSGSPMTTSVTIPFTHSNGTLSLRAIDNVGNEGAAATLPVSIALGVSDPYVPTVGNSVGLTSGGGRLDLEGDDVYALFPFPAGFSFPFFGETFTKVTISSNGVLYFSDPPLRESGSADDAVSSPKNLGAYKMIAGLWDDLDLRTDGPRPDAGVYIISDANRMIFRWQALPCNTDQVTGQCAGGAPINFEIELNANGVIKTRYGSGNIDTIATVGIGGGEPDGYVVASHSSIEIPIDLTNAAEVTFTPRAANPTPTPTPTPGPTPTPSPTPAPLQLILEEGGPAVNQAAALDAILHVRDLFPVVNTANLLNKGFDQNTRVVIFVANLELLPGEAPSNVLVNLVDANGQNHTIGAEDVRAVGTFGFAQVIFRIPSNLPVGTCTIKVLAHGQSSNTGTIRIRI